MADVTTWDDVTSPGRTPYVDGIFAIDAEHGFLPARPPASTLPAGFEAAQAVLDAMPVWLNYDAGQRGLLGTPGEIEDPVENLPNLEHLVVGLNPLVAEEAQALQVIFRGYAFLTSAYLLESAHHRTDAEGRYGKARRLLPAALAQPLVAAADRLGVEPWLDYHYAYSLGNFVFKDPSVTGRARWDWSNLGMACRFTGTPDETGFIMLHVHINGETPELIAGIEAGLHAAGRLHARQGDSAEDVAALRSGLAGVTTALQRINAIRREMWKASRPERYNDFRVFIMGITGNERLFGPGVVYESVERFGGRPQQFRGQTGAQDDIIPTCDLFLGIARHYPTNELTRYLQDLRRYRPPVVRRFLHDLNRACQVLDFPSQLTAHPEVALQAALAVDEVYRFRNGHWQFVQRYILANTRHETATGGTPITTWLPNQVLACLESLGELLAAAARGAASFVGEDRDHYERLRTQLPERLSILRAQLEELGQPGWDVERVWSLNAGHFDSDSGAEDPRVS